MRRWTGEEHQAFRDMKRQGKSYREIGAVLSRSQKSAGDYGYRLNRRVKRVRRDLYRLSPLGDKAKRSLFKRLLEDIRNGNNAWDRINEFKISYDDAVILLVDLRAALV